MQRNVPLRLLSLLLAVCCAACSGGGGSGATQLTLISIQVSPASVNILPGQNLQFQATGSYSDGSMSDITMRTSWASSQTSVANIGATGQASALASGSTPIQAQLGGVTGTATLSVAPSTWHVARYEAEAGTLSGAAAIVGAADGSDRVVGDLGGEASGRKAVNLIGVGDSVAWTVAATEAGANALVLRFSIPDAPGGGGLSGSIDLAIDNRNGASRFADSLQLTSRYSWLYGGVMDGTKLYNVPANATTYATASTPTHLYDEIQLKLPIALAAGDTITLARNMAAAFGIIALDFVELETVPAALTLASGYLSLTDPRCGAIPLDLRNSRSVFDGADDSSYGSVFNAVIGINPYNPASFSVQEKVYYSTNPATDALQDTVASAASAGMSMFALADHNLHSLQTCLALAAASGSGLAGVFVPPGRYYVRGVLAVPSNVALQGAGMWYTKFTAVDTEAPSAVTVNGRSGIAGLSGNLVISSPAGGSSSVRLSNFAIFGNVTQRDVVDSVIPDGIRAQLINSTVDNVWVEHTFSGIKADQNSSKVTFSNSRVRNTFADGIDFYGSTSQSSIVHSSARSTGDDGFAMWSQGTTVATTSQTNSIANSIAELQWYGNGFAVYGGNQMSVTQSVASDILNYPCLQMSTQFVSSAIPSTASMSAAASGLDFYRCGGNGFNQQFGAVLLGTDVENVNGMSLSQIRVASPTYKGIDIRSIPLPASKTVVANFANVALQGVDITAAPACATVGAYTGGAVQFNDVCSCSAAGSAPQACAVGVSASSALQLTPNICSATSCPAF